MPYSISFKYPKIEEDEHYHFFFYRPEGYEVELFCSFYFVNTNFKFIYYQANVWNNYNILMEFQ